MSNDRIGTIQDVMMGGRGVQVGQMSQVMLGHGGGRPQISAKNSFLSKYMREVIAKAEVVFDGDEKPTASELVFAQLGIE